MVSHGDNGSMENSLKTIVVTNEKNGLSTPKTSRPVVSPLQTAAVPANSVHTESRNETLTLDARSGEHHKTSLLRPESPRLRWAGRRSSVYTLMSQSARPRTAFSQSGKESSSRRYLARGTTCSYASTQSEGVGQKHRSFRRRAPYRTSIDDETYLIYQKVHSQIRQCGVCGAAFLWLKRLLVPRMSTLKIRFTVLQTFAFLERVFGRGRRAQISEGIAFLVYFAAISICINWMVVAAFLYINTGWLGNLSTTFATYRSLQAPSIALCKSVCTLCID